MVTFRQKATIYLHESGAGSPTLFLHGAPDSADMWNAIIERLKGQLHCFAPDLPGFGRSTVPADFSCSLEGMAAFIEELVESKAIPTPLNLVVTDFGATYGLAWAASYPQKVRRLAIVGSANFSSRYRWHRDARMLRVPLLGELSMASLSAASFTKMMQKSAPLLAREHLQKTYDLSLAKPESRRMMLRLYRSINPADFDRWEDRLHALMTSVPSLVLWGDQDPFIAPAMAEQFSGAQIEHFPQNGHWLAVEAPEAVAQRLATFFV